MKLSAKLLRKRFLIPVTLITAGAYLFANFGVIVISIESTPDNKPAKVALRDYAGTKGGEEFELELGRKKISLVSKSKSVQVIARSQDSYQGAVVDWGLAGYKNIKISIDKLRKVEAIGSSPERCAVDYAQQNYVFYYDCGSGSNITSLTRDGVNYSRNSNQTGSNPSNGFIKPYLDGYLSAQELDGQVRLQAYSLDGSSKKPLNTQNIEYSGGLKGRFTVDDTNRKSESVAIFNQSSKELALLDRLSASPRVLNLNKDLEGYEKNASMLSLSNGMLALFSGSAVFVDEGENISQPAERQSFFFISHATGKVVKKVDVDKKLRVVNFALNNDKIIFYAISKDKGSSGFYVAGSEGVKRVRVPGLTSQNACWKDGSSFYYVLNNRDVLLYSLANNTFSLVYSTNESLVYDLSCYGGDAYVSYSAKNSSAMSPRLSFIKILNGFINGRHAESLLPLGPGALLDIDKAYSFRNNVYVDLINTDIYDPAVNPLDIPKLKPKDPEKHKNNALNYFRDKGVDVSQYNFVFSF